MKDYEAHVINSSRELTAREKIKAKDTGDGISLDTATQAGPVVIDFDYYVQIQVHNEKADDKDYNRLVIIDKNGDKYFTGSQTFTRNLLDIVDEMRDVEEDNFQVKAYRRPSKNYQGRDFISCSVI